MTDRGIRLRSDPPEWWAAAPRWTLDHGQLRLDGEPLLTLIRAQWGDGAPPEARLDRLAARIVDLLNAEGTEA